jgi:chromosome segregation ATPase
MTENEKLRELLKEAREERDEARAERNHFKSMLRERAEELVTARVEIERLNALLNGVVGACKYACNRESHCGVCAIAFKGISP